MEKDLKKISIIITITGIFVLTWLIINRGGIKLLEKPLSAIGNIPTNYLMFLIGSGLVFYFVILFLIKIHIKEKIKINWEFYALPIFVVLTLIIPYRDDFLLGKILHTTTGIIGSLIILLLMYKINKHYFPQNPLIKKITNNIPTITFIGTLTLFITTGLNTIMQLFYLTMSLIWINLTAFSKSQNKIKEKKQKTQKEKK
jgi:hypothetical protein